MNKTVCELFAGVGGFRCGLNNIKSIEDKKEEKWETVWFSQWNQLKRRPSMHIVVMCIVLVHVWIKMVMIQLTGI